MSEIDKRTATMTDRRGALLRVPDVRILTTPEAGPAIEAPLGLEAIVIGTAPECAIAVADRHVSRQHCRLSLTSQGIVLEDLGSKNGTFIESVRIEKAILDLGRTARIGDTRFIARVGGASASMPLYPAERFGDAVGATEVMRVLFARLDAVAASKVSILLTGEPGSGKFTLADAIHKASPRSSGPFVVLDCKAISDENMEAALLGRASGAAGDRAGLLEVSHGGTLYIDEPAEMPIGVQHALLRALQKGELCPVGSGRWRPFDTRVISGTRQNLAACAAFGEFVKALYERLAGLELHVPPLRGQQEQILALIEHALAKRSPPMAASDLPPEALEMLTAHSWPGNVSELWNVLDKLTVPTGLEGAALESLLGRGGSLHIEMGPILGMRLRAARAEVIKRFERAYIKAKLEERKGNKTRAAEAMGVTRQRLHDMMRSLGLEKKQ